MHDHLSPAKIIEQAIAQAQRILIISHQSPDGDTVGSAGAWYDLLTTQNKQVQLFCIHPIPAYLHYLSHAHCYTSDEKKFDLSYDLVLIVDCASLEYAGVADLMPRLSGKPTIINIDHHFTNTHFGHHNLVINTASSTCEVIARLFKHWGIQLSQRQAQALMTGIITDTSGLLNPATRHTTLTITSYLIQHGADIKEIFRLTHQQKTVSQLILWGRALDRLRKHPKHSIATTYITDDDLQEIGVTADALEGLANYLAVLNEADVIMVLKQDQEIVRGSLRTPFDHIDVSRLAKELGGGGHKKAAGFIIPGTLIISEDNISIK